MLSHNDIHYLVGLLSLTYGTDSITDIELGSMVYDTVAEKKRDVDITIKYKDTDKLNCAIIGIEIKDERRPLDVEKVEQICKKFSDMPNIVRRFIVSTSGYTSTAVKKAEADRVELLELADWDFFNSNVNWINLRNKPLIIEKQWRWLENYTINFISDSDNDVIIDETSIVSVLNEGNISKEFLLRDFANIVGTRFVDIYQNTDEAKEAKDNTVKHIDQLISVEGNPTIKSNGMLINISRCHIMGSLTVSFTNHNPTGKVLLTYKTREPYIFCFVFELNGRLMGITTHNNNDNAPVISYVSIPQSTRLLNKLRGIKLR